MLAGDEPDFDGRFLVNPTRLHSDMARLVGISVTQIATTACDRRPAEASARPAWPRQPGTSSLDSSSVATDLGAGAVADARDPGPRSLSNAVRRTPRHSTLACSGMHRCCTLPRSRRLPAITIWPSGPILQETGPAAELSRSGYCRVSAGIRTRGARHPEMVRHGATSARRGQSDGEVTRLYEREWLRRAVRSHRCWRRGRETRKTPVPVDATRVTGTSGCWPHTIVSRSGVQHDYSRPPTIVRICWAAGS